MPQVSLATHPARRLARFAALGLALAFLLPAGDISAKPRKGARASRSGKSARRFVVVDRAVVRFSAPEIGGVNSPRFISERELAFQARLAALVDPGFAARGRLPYRSRHVRAALEQHISETLLAGLRITPKPSEAEIRRRTVHARLALFERAGGERAVVEAARAEGVSNGELLRVMRRQARASLYLDRMVTPMFQPSEAELRAVHRAVANPYRDKPYPRVKVLLRRWYVSRKLAAALQGFYRNARSRLRVTIL